VVGRAGTRLVADLADAIGLSAAMSEALAPLRRRERGHDPGRVAVDLAVMLADGGEAIADLAVLRNQGDLFGSVASDATAWRVLDSIDTAALDRIRVARARARELAWAQAAETGRLCPLWTRAHRRPGAERVLGCRGHRPLRARSTAAGSAGGGGLGWRRRCGGADGRPSGAGGLASGRRR